MQNEETISRAEGYSESGGSDCIFRIQQEKVLQTVKRGKNIPFMAMYGSRRLIIRAEFAKYLEKHPELRRRT